MANGAVFNEIKELLKADSKITPLTRDRLLLAAMTAIGDQLSEVKSCYDEASRKFSETSEETNRKFLNVEIKLSDHDTYIKDQKEKKKEIRGTWVAIIILSIGQIFDWVSELVKKLLS